jgi:hypothetical protein
VRAEKVRRFPFWKCAHAKPAHFQIPGNQVRQSKVRRFPFLRMREIKIQGTQKVRGASLIRLLTGPSGKVRTEKVRRFPFWECALSNSWNAMRGKPAHNQIRGTQKRAQVCILFSELCFRPILSTQNTNYNANATNTATAAPVITASARE